jgi:hypothetical protein
VRWLLRQRSLLATFNVFEMKTYTLNIVIIAQLYGVETKVLNQAVKRNKAISI